VLFFLQISVETSLIAKKRIRMTLYIVISVHMSSCEVSLLLSCFNVTFHGSPANGRRVVTCGRADTDRQTDKTDRKTERQTDRQTDRQA